MKIARITTGGQISLPAAVRKRWATGRVAVEDNGDHVVLKPIPDDPVAAVRGIFADRAGKTTDELRAIARADERRAEERRWRNR